MKPSEILRKYEWCKGELAEDQFGHSVSPWDLDACKFCALGAIERSDFFGGTNESLFVSLLHETLHKKRGDSSIVAFNDRGCKSKEEMISVLEEVERRMENENQTK